jgi:electron transfer flavoprotein alpha/beta subunit
MAAAILNWPQCTFASKFQLDAAKKEAICDREIDGGLETIKVKKI